MNKTEIVEIVAQQLDLTKSDTARCFNAILEAIEATLSKGESVTLSGFGRFEVYERKGKTVSHLTNVGIIDIPSDRLPRFVPSTSMKQTISKRKIQGKPDAD